MQDKKVNKGEAIFFEKDDKNENLVQIEASENCGFVWIAGIPLEEPIFQYGPFVMN